jgi:hypothetical protein
VGRRPTVPSGIGADALHALVKAGADSAVLRARLSWAEAEAFRKYVEPMTRVERVHPEMLPIQASGRWSITDPPVVNFPDDAKADVYELPHIRDIFVPDLGHWWLAWDWDAMHARTMAAACSDAEDLQAFREGLDLHTMTACRVFKLPMPPSLVKDDIHTGAGCAAWRATVDWQGPGDRRRHLAKTVRYALLNAWDEKGVLEAKDVVRQGLTFPELLAAGRAFLKAKPAMPTWKAAFCETACKARLSRSAILGRPRRLFGEWREMAKAAVSHYLQGTEVDVLELTLIDLATRFPEARLAYPSHDGVKLQFPQSVAPSDVYPTVRAVVEAPYPIGDHTISYTASFEVVHEDGAKEALA